MKKENTARLAALCSVIGVAATLVVAAPAALAQDTKPAAPQAAPDGTPAPASTPTLTPKEGEAEMAVAEEPVYVPLQVGDATQGLLAWQRGGEIASATARPIAGDVASRSYERYIKSFEYPIPERMSSIVKSSSSSGGGAPK